MRCADAVHEPDQRRRRRSSGSPPSCTASSLPSPTRRLTGPSSTVLGLCRICARCSPVGSAAARPGRTSGPGTLTVCTMVPMRSVPHRVICLLGLDDGAFPRGARVDGDDVLARDPAVGERDPRGEDRQLMLDAILAATEHLVITYTGADERTGARRPPAVPLGELLDALDDTGETGRPPARSRAGARPASVAAVRPAQRHARCARRPGPFSFDTAALAGALRRRRRADASPHRSWPAGSLIRRRSTSGSASSRRCCSGRPAGSCASGSTSRCGTKTTSPPTRSPSSWTPWSSGRSATGCSADRLAGADARDLHAGRVAPRRAATRAARRPSSSTAVLAEVEPLVTREPPSCARRRAAASTSSSTLADGASSGARSPACTAPASSRSATASSPPAPAARVDHAGRAGRWPP